MRPIHLAISLVVALSILAAGRIAADTIHLKSGGKIEGKIIEQDDQKVVISIGQLGTMTFRLSEIKKIEKDDRTGEIPPRKKPGDARESGTDSKAATTPATPRDAVIQFTQGMFQGDEKKLFAAVEATPEQKKYCRVSMELATAAVRFRDAFIEAYGSGAWEEFQDPSGARLNVVDLEEKIAHLRKIPIDERGDKATLEGVWKPGDKIEITRVKGGWRVASSSFCPAEEKIQSAIDMHMPVVKMLRKYKKAIGRPGIKPEDIDFELGREFIRVLKGKEILGPRRFDIDKH